MNLRVLVLSFFACSSFAQFSLLPGMGNSTKVTLSGALNSRCGITLQVTSGSGQDIGTISEKTSCDQSNWLLKNDAGNTILQGKITPNETSRNTLIELLDGSGNHLVWIEYGESNEIGQLTQYMLRPAINSYDGYVWEAEQNDHQILIRGSNNDLLAQGDKNSQSTRYGPIWDITFINDLDIVDPRQIVALVAVHALYNSPPAKDVEYGVGFGVAGTVVAVAAATVGFRKNSAIKSCLVNGCRRPTNPVIVAVPAQAPQPQLNAVEEN